MAELPFAAWAARVKNVRAFERKMSDQKQGIAEMAEKASREPFRDIGWGQVGPENQNRTYVAQDKHEHKRSKPIPSEVMFRNDAPWSGLRQYFGGYEFEDGLGLKGWLTPRGLTTTRPKPCSNLHRKSPSVVSDILMKFRGTRIVLVPVSVGGPRQGQAPSVPRRSFI